MRRGLLLALVVLLAAPAAASAHARLVDTVPERGATLEVAPRQVELRFTEPVEAAFGAVQVFDAEAERVDDGRLSRPGGRSSALAVGLRAGLPDGSYTATYRIISADGHPVSGGLVFSVGDAGAGPAKTVGELLGEDAGPVTRTALDAARATGYGAGAVVVGGVLFLVVCIGARPGTGPLVRRARLLLVAAAGVGAVSALLALVLQGAVASGATLWDALDPDVVQEVAGTRTGTALAVRAGAFAAAAAVLAVGGMRPGALVALLPVDAALVATPALGGHAGVTAPRGAMVAFDVAHVLAMSVWLGGLVLLLLAVPAATGALEPTQRTRLLAGVLTRFSPLALGAVALLLGTGIAQSIVHLTALDDLLDSAFGRAVLVKGGLVVALVGLGRVNRARVLPRLRAAAAAALPPAGSGRLLRRTVRAEVALLVVVLGVTGALTGASPPASLAGGPVSARVTAGPLLVEVTVDPAQTGPNELHLYLFRARDGTQYDDAEEVTATLRLGDRGITLPVTLRKSGPGHFVGDALAISPAGDWRLEVAARVSDFDEHRAVVEVGVR